VRGREILGTCLNSASKNTSETDIIPHGTKSLLTSLIIMLLFGEIKKKNTSVPFECYSSVALSVLKKMVLVIDKQIDKYDQETQRNSLSA